MAKTVGSRVRVTRAHMEPGSRSARLFDAAVQALPGGNTRTTIFMHPHPVYVARGAGCWITDVDGDERLDCVNNYTSLIHGHAHPVVTDAVIERVRQGTAFSLPAPEEVELASLLVDRLPTVDRVRF